MLRLWRRWSDSGPEVALGKRGKRRGGALQAVTGMYPPERIYQALDNGQPLPVYLLIYRAGEGERYTSRRW